MTAPFMSVIVPVYQGAHVLPRCLSALRASEMPRGSWELIIVDDASTDATALIAAEFADAVVRLPDRPRGPAYARNRGVELARGEIVVFVDADVCVHTDTLRKFTSVLANEPEVSAVFGAYDTQPGSAAARVTVPQPAPPFRPLSECRRGRDVLGRVWGDSS